MTHFSAPLPESPQSSSKNEYVLIKMQIALLQSYFEQEGLDITSIYLKKALHSLCNEKSNLL